MENNKITGLVKAISVKNGGVLLTTPKNSEGVWWNGIADQAKLQVKNIINGDEVILSIVDSIKHTFSYLKVTKENVPCKEKEMSKGDYWARKEELDIIKDKKITKMACLNTAVGIIGLKHKSTQTNEVLFIEVRNLAQEIISFVEE